MRLAILVGVVVLAGCGGGSGHGDAGVDAMVGDASNAKAITSFAFMAAENPGLTGDVSATIAGTTITARLPFADLTGLTATFETTGARVAIGGTVQVSGATPNDFTTPITYEVTAADGSSATYTATVISGFAPRTDIATGMYPLGLAVADFNGDGTVDVAVAAGPASIYLDTTPTGSTTPSVAPGVDLSTFSTSVATGDFNRDGKADVAFIAPGSGASVFLGTTTSGMSPATFSTGVDLASGQGAFALGIGDVDGDGAPDLAVVDACTNSQSSCSDGISVFLNTTAMNATAPTFAQKLDIPTAPAHGAAATVEVVDINGDGKADLVYANGSATAVTVFLSTTAMGANAPSFAAGVDIPTGTGHGALLATGDLNADGKPDVAFVDGSSNSVSVLFNTTAMGAATPTFATRGEFAAGMGPASVAIADLDGDTRPDLAVANSVANTVSVLLNRTAPAAMAPVFASKLDFATGVRPFKVVSGDFNSDGKMDLAVANFMSNTMSILLGP